MQKCAGFSGANSVSNKQQKPERPVILTDVYARRPCKAAEFGIGARGLAEAQQATDARREAPVGKTQYADRRGS